jgi:heme exporter protein B
MSASDGSLAKEPRHDHFEEPRGGLAVAVWATLKRDLVLLLRRRSEVLNPLVFFALVITLFPIGISPDPALLAAIAPGLLWVAALLAALLSLDSLFRADYDDGSLEQLLLTPQPLALLCWPRWPCTGC